MINEQFEVCEASTVNIFLEWKEVQPIRIKPSQYDGTTPWATCLVQFEVEARRNG